MTSREDDSLTRLYSLLSLPVLLRCFLLQLYVILKLAAIRSCFSRSSTFRFAEVRFDYLSLVIDSLDACSHIGEDIIQLARAERGSRAADTRRKGWQHVSGNVTTQSRLTYNIESIPCRYGPRSESCGYTSRRIVLAFFRRLHRDLAIG